MPVIASVLGVMMLIGIASLVILGWQGYRDYRLAKHYLPAEAEVIDYVTVPNRFNSGSSWQRRHRTARPTFVFRFTTKEGQQITARGYDNYRGRYLPAKESVTVRTGERHPCWYDPANPSRAVLIKRFNPHHYWSLLFPLGFIGFPWLLLRAMFARPGGVPKFKGAAAGQQLAWRLAPTASQQGMTGCMGIAVLILGAITAGLWMGAREYAYSDPSYTWLRRLLSLNYDGWWVATAVGVLFTGVFIWAFLVNVRWIGVPEPVIEVDLADLRPGESTSLWIRQEGPLRAETFTVSLLCEVQGPKGKGYPVRKGLVHRQNVDLRGGRHAEAIDFTATVSIPGDARPSNEPMAQDTSPQGQRSNSQVLWVIRVERKVSKHNTLESDFRLRVARA